MDMCDQLKYLSSPLWPRDREASLSRRQPWIWEILIADPDRRRISFSGNVRAKLLQNRAGGSSIVGIGRWANVWVIDFLNSERRSINQERATKIPSRGQMGIARRRSRRSRGQKSFL